jgi:hypothetical protein
MVKRLRTTSLRHTPGPAKPIRKSAASFETSATGPDGTTRGTCVGIDASAAALEASSLMCLSQSIRCEDCAGAPPAQNGDDIGNSDTSQTCRDAMNQSIIKTLRTTSCDGQEDIVFGILDIDALICVTAHLQYIDCRMFRCACKSAKTAVARLKAPTPRLP